MTSARQSAMVFALSLMLAFLSAEALSMQEKVLSRSGQDLKLQTSSKAVAADSAGNEDHEEDDDDDDGDDDNDDDAEESEKIAAAAAAAEKASAADAENAAEAALVQTAKPQPPSAAEKAAAEAERAAEVTEMQTTKPKKALVQYAKHTHHHHKHHEVDQQILVPPQASPAPALPFPLGQQPVPLPPSFAPAPSFPLQALTPSQLAKERALAKKEDELEGKITPHAVEQARLSKNVMMLEQELHANLQEQSELKQRIEYLSSEERSDQEIDASVEQVANETDSFAMANMMGRMWKEMRMFDVPMYAEHVAEKLRQLEKDQHKLEDKLAKTKAKLMPAEAPAKKTLGVEALGPIAENVEDALAPKAGAPLRKHVEAKTTVLSKLNFWGMSTGDQEYSLAYSIVYLVAGITLAFIFNKVRSSKPQLLTVAEKSGTVGIDSKFPNSSDFSFSIFGCFDALNADGMPWPCLMGCFCPSLRWAHTVDSQGLLPYWKAFFAFFILTALHSYSYGVSSILVVGLGVVYRQKLRQKYHIEGGTKSVAIDILVWLCCQPCAIIQEAREESVLRSGGADSSYSGP